jgi:hypothetical protein
MGPLTDKEKFSGAAWDLQRTAGIFDYLPKTAKENPKGPPLTLVEVMQGKAQINDQKQGTNWAQVKLMVASNTSQIRINIFEFPNWKVFLDGKPVNKFIPEEEKWGRMWVDVPKGEHELFLKLYNTPLRTTCNLVSFAVWLGLGVYLVLQFKRGRRNLKCIPRK